MAGVLMELIGVVITIVSVSATKLSVVTPLFGHIKLATFQMVVLLGLWVRGAVDNFRIVFILGI